MAARRMMLPDYGTVSMKGTQYYRTRVTDQQGRRVSLYARTREELYQKEQEAIQQIENKTYRRSTPTVEEYCEKWLLMQSAQIRMTTLIDYTSKVKNYIIKPLGDMHMGDVTADDIRLALLAASKKSASVYKSVNVLYKCIFTAAMYMDEVTTDDLRLLMVPLSKGSSGMYGQLNMLIKNIFNSAEESKVIKENPSKTICARGGKPAKRREALTDEQTAILLDSIRELPPYVFVMIGLYAGLRREEILGLKWDCVFLDEKTPYISVRRAWHVEGGEPVVNTLLKTPAAKRDVPIPKCLVACLKEEREKSESEYVISNSKGTVLTETQFVRVWKYITVRSTAERCYYTYVNGQSIKHRIKPRLGEHQPNNPKLVYTMDFKVTPHMLRHTYITNLIYKGVDPKTVQYLAGHENSKTTMDIYAKVKYNKPEELSSVVNAAFGLR